MSIGSKCSLGVALLCVFSMLGEAKAQHPSFKNSVQAIFDANCVSCHQTGSAPQNLVLESGVSYRAIVNRQSTEAVKMLVAPGAPDSSYLLAKVLGTQAKSGGKGAAMPIGGTLQPEDIEVLRAWIAAGAPDN